ncbi:hypothetical protein LTR50_001785 [Elasticomyces elasticus]|nr:hypothetical protein LTR50_001785 [Elasticomyces elasticus]
MNGPWHPSDASRVQFAPTSQDLSEGTNGPELPKVSNGVLSDDQAPMFTLTLIRRDPASRAQWNVAKIRDPPIDEISSHSHLGPGVVQGTKTAGAPLYIDISNPGYTKFIAPIESRPQSAFSMDSAHTDPMMAPFLSDKYFYRRLWMDGSRFADHTYGHRKSSSNSSASEIEQAHQASGYSRSRSETSVPTTDRRSKGYAFLSPWNGRCDFSTGNTGRSLKCRHTLKPQNQGETLMSITVSELRFNLPGSNVFSSRNTSTEDEPGSKRNSFSTRPRVRKNTSSSELDTSLREQAPFGKLDLSLGREPAGGGFTGKQAKLGKLIVESEGQKMLDLLVAANMALWWRAYERV